MNGELEKRINKMLELTNFSSGKSPDYQQARVRQIIDEAKKDFPLDLKMLREAIKKYPFLKEMLIGEFLVWYETWIGDEK